MHKLILMHSMTADLTPAKQGAEEQAKNQAGSALVRGNLQCHISLALLKPELSLDTLSATHHGEKDLEESPEKESHQPRKEDRSQEVEVIALTGGPESVYCQSCSK